MKKLLSMGCMILFNMAVMADPLGDPQAQMDPDHDEQMRQQIQVLDNLDARIDEEERKGYLQPWQANQLRNEVQTLRDQEDNYLQEDSFEAKAAAIAQQLDPPFN